MPAWDDIQAELSRKAIETVSDLTCRHAVGDLTDGELITGINAIFDTISGLAPWDVTDLIYKIRKDLEAERAET